MKVLKLILRNLLRNPLRTLLTVAGVASALLLFVSIESLAQGLEAALGGDDTTRTLIVYRKNRYCPQTSFLPERYTADIAGIDGVETVLPTKVFLNNCRTNLDMITFHGMPVESLMESRNFTLEKGDFSRFRSEGDAALIGRQVAARRGLDVGDKFQFGDVTVKVAGIFSSPRATEEAVILTHLEYLQRAGPVDRLGTVTQFEVKVRDAATAEAVAGIIDERFATAEEPTDTRSEAEFLARATRDLREILGFGRIFGVGCVIVVLVLVANTVFMSVHERRREMGILRAMGFKAHHLVGLVLGEAGAFAAIGGLLGIGGAWWLITASSVAIGVEGVQVAFDLSVSVILRGVIALALCAAVAAVAPAVMAARTDVVTAIRSGG